MHMIFTLTYIKLRNLDFQFDGASIPICRKRKLLNFPFALTFDFSGDGIDEKKKNIYKKCNSSNNSCGSAVSKCFCAAKIY